MKILGISAYYHDSAAAIIEDGAVIAAAQEERFTRIKNDAAFPENAISYCLKETGSTFEDLDGIAFYDKPFLKFERLLETYYAYAPKGFRSFSMAMPLWLKEKLFIKQFIRKKIKSLGATNHKQIKVYFPEHHLSHAASAFYTSPFKQCAYLTLDGVGEWTTTSYGIANGETGLKVLGEIHFPDSLGLFYSSFTYFLGFEVNSGEYKMMGLAPYSKPEFEQVQRFKQIIETKLVDIKSDGSFKLNMAFFKYPVGLKMISVDKWEELFGFKKRSPSDKLLQIHADLAQAAQQVLEDILTLIFNHVKTQTNQNFLAIAGGVALNCVANSALFNKNIFDDIYIQPAAGDAGGAIGAALVTNYLNQDIKFLGLQKPFNVYLGPRYSNLEIERILKLNKCNYIYFEDTNDLLETVSNYLIDKKVIGWFQGRSEFGPRALGNRSILADATDPQMQYNLNMKIKFREGFRPFAPVVCEEDYNDYFKEGKASPYMLFTSKIIDGLRSNLPENFDELSLEDKRLFPKSQLPAITHIDFSARVQTVTEDMNPLLWNLLQSY